MGKFRRKPGKIVEAKQYAGGGHWFNGVCNSVSCGCGELAHVHTIHDNQVVILKRGDWILPEPDGKHFYPVKPDIFEATYEAVED